MAPAVPEKLARFRQRHEQAHFPRLYSGWAHLGFTTLASLTGIALAGLQLQSVRPLEWLAIPATFLFANLVEHRLHAGPMHHRVAALGIFYDRHTLSHHHYYPDHAMTAPSVRAFYMVLFPPWAVVALAVGVAPMAGLAGLLTTANTGWLFAATALGYFLSYEWLHLAYHLDPAGPVGRLPGLATLRRHHTIHHDPRRMGRYNFNVTFPIADWIFGTLYAERAERRPAAEP